MKEAYTIKPGYDTIRLYLDRSCYKHIEEVLGFQKISLKVKKRSPCGRFISAGVFEYRENVLVRLWFSKLKTCISFEPASLINGNNYQLADFHETRIAVLAICGLLNLPIEELKISRIDITANFQIGKKHIREYTNLFSHPPYMKLQKEYLYEDSEVEKGSKGKKNGNVYYAKTPKRSNRSVVVYKKGKLMRIEARFLRKPSQCIGDTLKYHTYATALFDEEFYLRAIDYYINTIVKKMCKKSPVELESIMMQLNIYEEAILDQKTWSCEPVFLNNNQKAA
ncbi:hypothetical protein OKW21_005818 [Catalinimonas alkaloidigena]|uniref:hypothetical protein n=1 Tax=Catalinimonas alkaloidigena TaxID=1075417 RepID=UPI0024056289|nr:hypothetical protein [Catalinimonas alkaloidigena]MDF9800555.1 hypothetical protein [Catalinimonas alkaloidigena]